MYLSLHEWMAFRILDICKAYCVIRIFLLLIISEANNKHVFRNAKLRHRAWQSSTRASVDMVAFVHMSFARTCSITVPSYGLPEDPSWEITRAVCLIPKIHLKVIGTQVKIVQTWNQSDNTNCQMYSVMADDPH